MTLDLGEVKSPKQNGILHQLGILLVAKVKYLSDAQLTHQAAQYPWSLHPL